MTRKDFLQKASLTCVGVCTGAISLLQGCSGVHYAVHTHDASNQILQVNTREFWDAKKNKSRKFVIVRTEKLPFPIYLRKEAEQYVALYMCCTHKGCELNPAGEFLVCPCHGSEFDKEGHVQNPPADKDLVRFPLTVENEIIRIHIQS